MPSAYFDFYINIRIKNKHTNLPKEKFTFCVFFPELHVSAVFSAPFTWAERSEEGRERWAGKGKGHAGTPWLHFKTIHLPISLCSCLMFWS